MISYNSVKTNYYREIKSEILRKFPGSLKFMNYNQTFNINKILALNNVWGVGVSLNKKKPNNVLLE